MLNISFNQSQAFLKKIIVDGVTRPVLKINWVYSEHIFNCIAKKYSWQYTSRARTKMNT
ncbi:MAG: hypothetical protein FWE03_02460 [Firmicutes bacterium]|nr:hypothetical protein [Bacillota bacterium]